MLFDTSKFLIEQIDIKNNFIVKYCKNVKSYVDKFIDIDDKNIFTRYSYDVSVEFVLIKTNSNNKKVICYFPSWGGDFRSPTINMEIAKIASLNEGFDIIVINSPSAGKTSPIPKNLSKGMVKHGSFFDYGKFVADSLKSHLSNYKEVKFFGFSIGARIALATACHIKIDQLHIIDPPGSINMGYLAIIRAFMREARYSEGFLKNSKNKFALEVKKQSDTPLLAFKKFLRTPLAKKVDLLFDQPKVIGASGLEIDLKTVVLSDNVQELIITVPELSELSDYSKIIKSAMKVNDINPQMDLFVNVVIGTSHAVGVGGIPDFCELFN